MHRRQVLARVGVGLSSLAAGCGSISSVRETEQETVNPAVDGTATPTADPTPPSVGDWHVELDTTEASAGIYDDRVVVAEQFDDRTRVRGFDVTSGKRVYERTLGTRYRLPEFRIAENRYSNGIVILDGPQVRLLDATTGETVWKHETPAAVSFREPGACYVFAGGDEWTQVLVLDTETWTRQSLIDTSAGFFGRGDGYVLRLASDEERTDGTETPPIGTGIACHDTETGDRLWTTTLPVPLNYPSPTRVDDSLVLGGGQMVACYDFETGTRRYTVKTDVPPGEPVEDDDERVYFGNYNGGETGRVVAFDSDGEVWRRDFGGERAVPRYYDGRFYVHVGGPERSRVVRVDSATGTVRWRQRGQFHDAAGDGDVYIRRGSRVARIDDDGSVVWQTALEMTLGDRPRFWRQCGDAFLAWDGGELVALDAATGAERTRISGFDSLDGLVSRVERTDSSDRVFLDFGGSITTVSV